MNCKICKSYLSVGDSYHLGKENCICLYCKNIVVFESQVYMYKGLTPDYSCHNFRMWHSVKCPHCHARLESIYKPCQDNEGIEVTEEFESIPVFAGYNV